MDTLKGLVKSRDLVTYNNLKESQRILRKVRYS